MSGGYFTRERRFGARDSRVGIPEERGRLSGGPDFLPLLQPMQIIGGALRMRGRSENGPVIALQHVKPGCEIGRVIVARLMRSMADFRGVAVA
jgi:hypothetical protein